MSKITVRDVGRMFGLQLPAAPGKASCPLRKHHRKDKTFRVFRSKSGTDDVWKCWSCDPPDNVGDAVGLFALLAGVPRRDAWMRLRDMGYDVGQDRTREDRGPRPAWSGPAPARAPEKPKIGVRGTVPASVLPLDPALLDSWRAIDDAPVGRFLASRGFDPGFDFRAYGVIAMPRNCVGFTYVDPLSSLACRVKVRGLRDKVFWNEPRPDASRPGAKALAPLYLADRLEITGDVLEPVIITEGELDALSLVSLGLPNVVSLPDGAESAGTVSVEPLTGIFRTWLVAVDDDDAGTKAWRTMRDRARAAGAEAVRIVWSRPEGDEIQRYKDANDALKAGWSRDDFLRAMQMAMPTRRVA